MHTPGLTEMGRMLSSNANNIGVEENWHLWCRLCAKEDAQGNISVFFKDEQQTMVGSNNSACEAGTTFDGSRNTELSLAAAIEKFFWVHIPRSDALPKMLCTECFTLVTALANFSERVTKVQQLFRTLENTCDKRKLDLHAVRLKYGLLDEDREHVITSQTQPEVHYFEAKPKINDLEEKMFEADPTAILVNPLEQQPARIRIRIKKENLLEESQLAAVINEEEEAGSATKQQVEEEEEQDDEDEDPFNADSMDNTEDEEFIPEKMPRQVTGSSSDDDEHDEMLLQQKMDIIKTELAELQETTPKKRRRARKRKHMMTLEENADSDVDGSPARKKPTSSCFVCTDCPRKFKRVQHFRQHMKRAHSKLPTIPELSCAQCARAFSTQHQLEKHVKVHLPLEAKKVLPCPYCGKKFTTTTLVQTHVKHIHMNERPFICEECGVTVRTNAALKAHMLTHTDFAPFECEVCKKGFKNQIRLKNHMETHDPNKHICAECGMQLNSRATLNRHLLVHSDEMQHKCDYCGRAFKRAKALKNHLILHTGLKPYSCDFCDRTFANGSNCRSHKKKAHPEQLAALEAAGGGKIYTRNIPKLEALKAVTKAADNLAPVVSKQSGRFAFGKKPRALTKDEVGRPLKTGSKKMTLATAASARVPNDERHALHTVAANNRVATMVPPIPTIDNIYSHIMKQAHMAASALDGQQQDTSTGITIHIKRPASQASSCVTMEQDISSGANTSADVRHQLQQQLLLQQQQQSQPATPTSAAEQHFYAQIVKHNMPTNERQSRMPTTLQQQQHQQALLNSAHQHDDIPAIRSPDSQASHLTNANVDEHSNTSNAHFFTHQISQRSLQGPYL